MKKTAYGSRNFRQESLKKPVESCQTLNDGYQVHRANGQRLPAQMLRVMRMLAFLLLAAFLHTHATGSGQSVTLSGKNLTLKQVFAAIKTQTGYAVFYNKEMLEDTKPVSLTVYDMQLSNLLTLVLDKQALEFEIQGKTVIVSEKANVQGATGIGVAAKQPYYLEQYADTISGRVISAEGEPLIGATIMVKNKKTTTVTDRDGYFTIEANKDDFLSISYVGYEKQELKVVKTGMLVILKLSHSVLDETQITAYGKTTRRLATGNIGTVKAADIEKQPVLSPLEALVGRIPGLEITSVSGNAAAPMRVVIRGRSSINDATIADPLYVIDGVPFSSLKTSTITTDLPFSTGAIQGGLTNTFGENPLLSINPRDIESIDVLKDADATAIYGSRGANGVILITTKKAKAGPARLNVRIHQGVKKLTRFPALMDTETYLAMRREAFANDGVTPTANNAPDLTTWDQHKFTDWQRTFIRTGAVTNIDVNLSGGTNQTTYGLAAAYASQQEIMQNDAKNQRGNFRANFNHASTDGKLNMSFMSNLSITDVTAYAIGMLGEVIPNTPDIYNSKGDFNYTPFQGVGSNYSFPFAKLKQPSESNTISLQSSANLQYEVVPGLALSATAGYQFFYNKNSSFTPAASLDPRGFVMSQAMYGNSNNKNWNIEPQIHFKQRIALGNLSVQAIGSLQNVATYSETVNAFLFPNDALMRSYNNAAMAMHTEAYKEYRYVSMSGIIRYDWANKYIINLNGRRDGSSRFGPGSQFGMFGSVGAAWITSEEDWFKRYMPVWMSYMKFRGSYGHTGSESALADYAYLSRWSKNMDDTDNGATLYTYNDVEGYHVIQPLHQTYHWEKTRKGEIALSLAFLKNRINVEVATYKNVTNDQLTQVPTPKTSGFDALLTNFPATIENKGVELNMEASVLEGKDWFAKVNFNYGRNKNRLTKFPDLEKSNYNGRFKVGESIAMTYVYQYLGIDPATGTYAYRDFNGDGLVQSGGTIVPISDDDDRRIAIDLSPKFSGGFGFTGGYKSITISGQFSYIKKYRTDPYLGTNLGAPRNSVLSAEIADNHWQYAGHVAKYAKYSAVGILGPSISGSDANYIDGSFVRMTNLAASWQLPTRWLHKIKMKGASVHIETQNIFVLSRFKGLSPDFESAAFLTPVPRTITTALSFNF